MRIAIVSSYYPWPPSVGGVETIVREVSIELFRRGHDVHVITTPYDVSSKRQVAPFGVGEIEGVIVHKLKPGAIHVGYARFIEDLKSSIHMIQPDVVHAHNLHPHLFQLSLWKRTNQYSLMAELHHPAVELDYTVQKVLLPPAMTILKALSNNVYSFIAHTRLEHDWLVASGIDCSKVRIVRFPALASMFLVNRDKVPVVSYLGDVVYFGRIVRRKGLHVLIKSLSIAGKQLKGLRANIAGPSDPTYLMELQDLVRRLDLESVVHFSGIVPEENKVGFLRAHKVLVLPSVSDYTPNVLLEAQALGLPVIASRVGAVPEMMVENVTGLLSEPEDETGLAEAIIKMLSDEKYRLACSLRGTEFAKGFALSRSVDDLVRIYDDAREKN